MFEDWEREFCWLSHWLLWRHVFGFFFLLQWYFLFLVWKAGETERERMNEWMRETGTDKLPTYWSTPQASAASKMLKIKSKCPDSQQVPRICGSDPTTWGITTDSKHTHLQVVQIEASPRMQLLHTVVSLRLWQKSTVSQILPWTWERVLVLLLSCILFQKTLFCHPTLHHLICNSLLIL